MSILRIGHRGAAGHAPENTLASFQKALDFRVDGVELDIHQCASGELIVIHDETVDRTTNGNGIVTEMTLAELKQLDAGNGEKLPTLTELLDFLDRRILVMIEIKAEGLAKPTVQLIERYVKKGWRYDQFQVISFDHHQLLEIHQLNAQIPTGANIAAIPIHYAEYATHAKAHAANPCINHISEAFVKDAHARKLQVFTWTPNTHNLISKARSLGVDGILSDYPDRL